MALSGSFNITSQRNSTTNFTSESITWPANLESSDPNYDKRGTTEDVLVPETETYTVTSYTSSYVTLKAIGIHYEGHMDANPRHRVHVQYNVYDNKAARDNDFNNPITTLDVDAYEFYDATTGSFDTNIVQIAYQAIKNQSGWGNMQDV